MQYFVCIYLARTRYLERVQYIQYDITIQLRDQSNVEPTE